METRIISLVNHKGGVGKTTSTLNLGKALSLLGKKVLLVDIDPQANLSQSVGIDNPEQSIYESFMEDIHLPVIEVTEYLHIVPSELNLSVAEIKLQSEQLSGYMKLRNKLENIKSDYDFVLIDCPPTLGILTVNAIIASDEMVIVVEPQFLAVKGLQAILEMHESLQKSLNRQIKIIGILFTQYNRTVVSRNIIESLHVKYKDLPFNSIIRQSVKLAEASAKKQDIFTYDNASTGTEDYTNLAKEILK